MTRRSSRSRCCLYSSVDAPSLRQSVLHPPVLPTRCLQQRFVLDEQHQPPRIRAAQGHSVALADPQLAVVTDAAAAPVAVHATSQEARSSIQASGELRRMSRCVSCFRVAACLCGPVVTLLVAFYQRYRLA